MLLHGRQGTKSWRLMPGIITLPIPLLHAMLMVIFSDSRSGQVIDDRIRPTLESGSAVGSKKPVCLVIDEIDGATGSGENV